MTGPTCPACGVTVLPGYARCPKCKAPLPYGSGSRGTMSAAGGTALEDKKLPVMPLVLVGAALVAGVAYFALRKSSDPKQPATEAATSVASAVVAPIGSAAPPPPTTPELTSIQATPSPGNAAARLEASLKKVRLWSTVEAVGARIDVRSGACDDPQMATAVDGASQALHDAGVTSLRCLEKTGKVVFTRAL